MSCELSDRDLDAWIAEHVMGWTDLEWRESKHGWNTFSPKGWYGKGPNKKCFFREGRFTQDLNACREAEMKLTDAQRDREHGALVDMGDVIPWLATARQRCEAIWGVIHRESINSKKGSK